MSLYSKPMFEVFQGAEQPSSTVQDGDIKRVDITLEWIWKQANQHLWSVLFLTTSGSANNVVKGFEGKQPEGGIGNGQAALEALRGTYNNHTHGARRACHEKLVTTRMDPGQDPDDLFFILDNVLVPLVVH